MNRYDFTGRTAVVTGGATGIGLACANRIVSGGGVVAIWDRDQKRAEEALKVLGGQGITVTCDVADEESVHGAAQGTERAFGQIDILIASAGITGPNRKTWEYDLRDWNQVMAIDLTGVFLCCKAIVPGMMARGYGRIVNIASVAGKEGNPNAPAYSAAKAGLIGLTKSLGKELAGTGVTCNCVTPAAVKTEMFSQMTDQHIQFMLSKIPMNRFGTVEEIAALVAWLASAECSFSTGAVFDCSGGRATY
ncbi:MAG: SDR family oxidoreductase [Alphaproteobacteria bacterium]|nr:SDR family oxidoreductase [Alphaproteobacteria bacterium]